MQNKEKQKSKKSLKKIIAWALGLGVLVGGIIGGVAGAKAYKEYNTTGNGAYNKLIEESFERTNKSLNGESGWRMQNN